MYAPQRPDASTRHRPKPVPSPSRSSASQGRYQRLEINCSTLTPASRKILRGVPKAISSCSGTVTGSFWVSVGCRSRTWLPFCRTASYPNLVNARTSSFPEITGSLGFIELRQHCQPELRCDRESLRRGFPCLRGPVRLLHGYWQALRKHSFPASSILERRTGNNVAAILRVRFKKNLEIVGDHRWHRS